MMSRQDRQQRRGGRGIKGAISHSLASIGPTASAVERVAIMIEVILKAYIEAEEFTGFLRRRDDTKEEPDSFIDKVIDRILERVEMVVEIPFVDEEID